MNTAAALSLAVLMAGPFARPMTAAPQVTRSAAEAEAQKQVDFLLEARIAEQDRLMSVADRLLRANVDLCPDKRGRLGMNTANVHEYRGPLKAAAVRRWALGEPIKVVGLAQDGAAAAAGMQIGDELVSLEGRPVEGGKRARDRFARQLAAVMAKNPETVRVGVRRAGEVRELTLRPVLACAYDVVLDTDGQELNAYADGRNVVITRPILRLASSDSELAYIVAHEIAHNARKHINAKARNQAVGALGGAALDVLLIATVGVDTGGALTQAGGDMGAALYSPEFETEADYVGLYYVTRAGFPIEGVENVWRKMAAEDPRAIFLRGSHPPTPERYLAITATRDEIIGKAGGASALVPNERAK